ncbi:hypothetical protein B2J88_52825, partial [Rhodococcus sp. SRB_17]|nr:hypothetical protein [Rhodococcus sp. SRB_17]
LTELIRRYLDNAATGVDGGQRPHVNVQVTAKDLAEHRDCASTRTATSDEDRDVEDVPVWGFDDLEDFDDLDVGHMPW